MIELKVATPEARLYDGKCERVTCKTTNGVMTILPKHVPLISTFDDGYIIIDQQEKIAIEKGLLTVGQGSHVEVLIMK